MVLAWLIILAFPAIFAVTASRGRRSMGTRAVWSLLAAILAGAAVFGYWSGSRAVPEESSSAIAHVFFWTIAVGGPSVAIASRLARVRSSEARRNVELAVVLGYAVLPIAAIVAVVGLLVLAGLTCRGTGCY